MSKPVVTLGLSRFDEAAALMMRYETILMMQNDRIGSLVARPVMFMAIMS